MKKILYPCVFMTFLIGMVSCEEETFVTAPEELSTEEVVEKASSWSTVFRDNFDANSNIDDNWERTGGRTDYNSELCHYKPWFSTLETLDRKQCLRLRARKYSNTEYRAGHVKSKLNFQPKNGEEYRVRASIKLIARDGNAYKGFGETYGAWPAFWTVQENQWPTRGEIDIMEGYSHAPANPHFASNLFYGTTALENQLENSCENGYAVSEGWHTYEMRWRKISNGWVSIRIYLDGSLRKTYTNNDHDALRLQNFGPHNIILNLNVGSDDGIFDNSKINLFSETSMYVDYVHLQRRTL